MEDASYVSVDFSCRHCGGKLETKDDVRTDASMVTCASCGAQIMTYGELIAGGHQAVLAKAKEATDAEFAKFKKRFECRR